MIAVIIIMRHPNRWINTSFDSVVIIYPLDDYYYYYYYCIPPSDLYQYIRTPLVEIWINQEEGEEDF